MKEFLFDKENQSRHLYSEKYSDTVKHLMAAGFQPDDFNGINLFRIDYGFNNWEDIFNDRVFKFIADLARDSKDRTFLLEQMSSNWLEDLNTMIVAGKDEPKKLDDAKFIILNSIDIFLNREGRISEESDFPSYIQSSFKIVLSNAYSLFDSDVEKAMDMMKTLGETDSYVTETVDEILEVFDENEYAKIIFSGCDGSVFQKLESIDLSIVNTKERAELVNKFLKLSGNWADKVQMFLEFMTSQKFNVVSENLSDKELLLQWAQKTAKSANPGGKVTAEKLLEAVGNMKPEEKFRLFVFLTKEADMKKIQNKVIESFKKSENPDLLTLAGIDRQTLERIRKRENPLHPLNTLKIAKTVGYEVEYSPFEVDKYLREQDGFEMLSLIGFNCGTGGFGAEETSPGPFFDPLTAITVFNLYADSGIIELRKKHSQTFHFNVGIYPPPYTQLTFLVRALYASGFAANPNIEDTIGELIIWDKGNYTEGKVFDVVSKEGFVWTMKSVSLLSWAMDADIRGKREDVGNLNKWDQKLAAIWKSYISVLDKGLASAGFENYLHSKSNSTSPVEGVMEQLRQIFPDPTNTDPSVFYRDISKFDNSTSPSLRPVILNGVNYSNIAHFVRVVTEQHVSQIENLANEIEAQTVADLAKIDRLSDKRERANAIRNFIHKYNTPVEGNKTDEAYERSYLKVRKIFVKQ